MMRLNNKKLCWFGKWFSICAIVSTMLTMGYLHFTAGDEYNFAAISWRNSSFTNLLLNDTIAKRLRWSPRILCFVMTTSQFEDTKARAVNATWGRRCTKLLFVTSYASRLFPSSYVAPSIEGRAHLTAKVMATLRHLHANHLHDYDFFVKADDDTYIVIENLKLLLSNLSADEPSYLGFHFRYNVHQGYMSGGGGYVLSRAALRAVVEEGILRGGVCASDGNDEDVDVGACLERVGVAPYTTHDAFGRHAFHVTGLKDAMVGPLSNYLSEYPTHGVKLGPQCCSQFSISFHYISPEMMYIMDFLLYRISVFGLDVDYASPHMANIFPLHRSVIPHTDHNEILFAQKQYGRTPFMPV